MIARKLQSLELFVRNLVGSGTQITEFGLLHMAEVLADLARQAEALEARPLPPHLRVVQGGKHEPGSAA